jgi:hypothetical protein
MKQPFISVAIAVCAVAVTIGFAVHETDPWETVIWAWTAVLLALNRK